MIQTSETVSCGHPDMVCDGVVAYLLDRYLEQDPYARFAVECQIKDNHVTLGGEVTSKAVFMDADIERFVREAVSKIGYTHEYAMKWGADNALDCDNLDIRTFIGGQSPDIAKGVDADGWGDQGIAFGMATNLGEYSHMPKDHQIAKEICQRLYRESRRYGLGIDIKTQVSVEGSDVRKIIVAVPMKEPVNINWLIGFEGVPKIINGTGAYVRHSTWGDCGTTGRKLAVQFYGGGCKIGGGAVFGKDATKADVSLNLYARKIALDNAKTYGKTVYCSISCCIGRREILVSLYDDHNNMIREWSEDRKAEEIIRELNLRKPTYFERFKEGLFYDIR